MLARQAKNLGGEATNTPPASDARDSQVPPPPAAAETPTQVGVTPVRVTPAPGQVIVTPAPAPVVAAPAPAKVIVTPAPAPAAVASAAVASAPMAPAPAPVDAPAPAQTAGYVAAPRRRTPLRRMPTELVMTTRMIPVRHPEKLASGVRPLNDLSLTAASREPEPAPFDRRPTAPIPREAATAAAQEAAKEAVRDAAELLELVDEREAALLEAELAQTVVPVRPRHRTPVPPPPAPVTAVARYAIEVNEPPPKQSVMPTGRHAAAHQDTSSGEFATAHAANSGGYAPAERRSEPPPPPRHVVAYGPAPMHRADASGGYAPAALRHAVDTRAYDEQTARHAAASVAYAAPMRRAEASGGYAPAAVHHADFAPSHHPAADAGYQPTQPRRASSTQWRVPNLAETEPDGHFPPRRDDDLTQVRRQLAAALESARKHEQRANEAELRASWAERYVPQLQDSEQEQRAQQRQKRMRWIKRVLEISCVGLALGGYISLLVPVRERVIAQDAMIHQLTALQQQLRDEKRALLQRIEEMQGTEATTPP